MPLQTNHLAGTRNLPQHLTPFIGRERDLAEITALLSNPDCRLLTLVGQGGIGKTRLATEMAANKWPDPTHGLFFVNLQPIPSAEFLISAIADTLNFSLSGQEEPHTQLFNYLCDKEMLLVLDNFEHLLAASPRSLQGETDAGSDLLTALLQAAPKIKLLITSREALNLQEEWLYPVVSLPFPDAGESKGEVADYDAVQLFITCVRRVRPTFSLAEEEEGIVRICQLVEGMPLALELAASWIKTMRCHIIADEIQRNIDFLATTFRNVPDRQRSMRAIFNQSWQLLTDDERTIFKQLSVFRGSFTREAAEQVAEASLSILSALVDKSLLGWNPDGRYVIHELLRQYAAEHLAQQSEAVAHARGFHSDYYTHFLQRCDQEIFSPKQQQIIREIDAEWENIRVAWEWAINQAQVGSIHRAAMTYYMFCDFQGRFRESTSTFEKAIAGLTRVDASAETERTLALLHVCQGWNYIRLGRFEQARQSYEHGQAIYGELGTEPPLGFGTDPVIGLALLAHIVGNYNEALKLGGEASRRNEARNDTLNLQVVYYVLGAVTLAQGNYPQAEAHLQRAYLLTQQTGNSWMMAYILRELGNVARGLGHLEQARQHYQAGYQLKETLNDPEGQASTLNHLAQVAALEGNHTEAKRLYQQSLSIYQEMNDRGGLAASLNGLGMTECALGNCQVARPHFQQALQITTEMQFVPLMLSILIGVAEMLLQTERVDSGLELLALALQHPAADRETQDRAQKCLDAYRPQVPVDLFAQATQRGQTATLETLIPTIQATLSAPIPVATLPPSNETAPSTTPDQSTLIEPLTSRELEVLQLIAKGHTNRQIADTLIISVGTAKWYTGQIYGKLGVTNRTQAVAHARELGLIA